MEANKTKGPSYERNLLVDSRKALSNLSLQEMQINFPTSVVGPSCILLEVDTIVLLRWTYQNEIHSLFMYGYAAYKIVHFGNPQGPPSSSSVFLKVEDRCVPGAFCVKLCNFASSHVVMQS
jgi:hypothetical protein